MVIILGLLGIVVAQQIALHNEERLISTRYGTREWMDSAEIHDLMTSETPFIDITNHQDLFEKANVKSSTLQRFPSACSQKKLVSAMQQNVNRLNLFETLMQLSTFWTRFCKSESGLQSSLWLRDLLLNVTSTRPDIVVRVVDHDDWVQKSLIVHIEGADTPEKVVVIGAHLDSINLNDCYNGRAPGADDNGSGTVTLIEALRVLVETGFVPANSIEFHWYSAEEIGLLGSLDIFADYDSRNISVKAMLEQDMTGASNRYRGEVGDEIRLVTDNVDPGLTEFLKLVVTDHTSLSYTLFACGYACSDFYSAYAHNYPSAFATERANEAVDFPGFPRVGHNEIDTIDRIDFTHMTQHVYLAIGYLVELALAEL